MLLFHRESELSDLNLLYCVFKILLIPSNYSHILVGFLVVLVYIDLSIMSLKDVSNVFAALAYQKTDEVRWDDTVMDKLLFVHLFLFESLILLHPMLCFLFHLRDFNFFGDHNL